MLPVASCTTFSNELGRIWKESIVPGETGKIAIRVTRSGPRTWYDVHRNCRLEYFVGGIACLDLTVAVA